MTRSCNHIAIVDDEVPVRKALARLLFAAQFNVKTYGSARDFIDSLRTHTPDCLVVDVHMPEFSGLDLLRYLKRIKRPVPAVVITAFDEPEIRAQCMAAGASGVLIKPLNAAAIIGAIETAGRAGTAAN